MMSISRLIVRRWGERARRARQERGGRDVKFMLLIYGDDQAAAQATPEQFQQAADAYEVFTKSIKESGNYLDGDPFLPTSTATTVRVTDGGTETTDGPAVHADPQLQAYYKV